MSTVVIRLIDTERFDRPERYLSVEARARALRLATTALTDAFAKAFPHLIEQEANRLRSEVDAAGNPTVASGIQRIVLDRLSIHEVRRRRMETDDANAVPRCNVCGAEVPSGSTVCDEHAEGLTRTTGPTYQVTIFCGLLEGYDGPQRSVNEALDLCQGFCDRVGLCVTVEPVTYVYKRGREDGVRVGLMAYPRFPRPQRELESLALELAALMRQEFRQHRVSVVTPTETIMLGPPGQEGDG